MEDEHGGASVDNIVNEFETYESFLDSQVTSLDLYYLEVRGLLASDPVPIPWGRDGTGRDGGGGGTVRPYRYLCSRHCS
ncbi:hypothetical protein chiPu_0010054 [Chiloscyllium punctatum]|uniref:Uncharacterized protein n=1 Tax=Chiloscyllium punctatum TaxID=137246 RepID=A0A401SMF5_CHIPU|nr:hypothetical protein [Chiloscyllium punctatum]